MAAVRKFNQHTPIISPAAYVAETAVFIGQVTVGEEANIWDGVVARGDTGSITIGKGVSVQENTVLHVGTKAGEDTSIGDYSLIGHASLVHGCEIGENCLIGMGAIIMNRVRIGENSIVGAGSLITEGKEFPPGSLIMGSPAKAVRALEEEEVEKIREKVLHYIKLANEHKKQC